jgi:hypothetical protein
MKYNFRPPLWSAFLAIDPEIRVGFPALRGSLWEVVGLERGPLSLVMIIEELFQGNSGSGRSVGIVRLRTKITEIFNEI